MKYIFITGMGRSGTTWLAGVLNCIKNVDAKHEYIGNREYWLLSWYLPGEIYALPFLEREKMRIQKEFKNDFFLDINGSLQNSIPEVIEVFKPERIFHLVRNGKDVVRSLYSRRSDKYIHIIPKTRTDVELWLDWNKFEQICWNWATTTLGLIAQNTQLVSFEKLIGDYTLFSENLLHPLGLQLEKSIWERLKSKREKQTQSTAYRYLYAKIKGKEFVRDQIPVYEHWTLQQKNRFKEICGEAMVKAGYDLD